MFVFALFFSVSLFVFVFPLFYFILFFLFFCTWVTEPQVVIDWGNLFSNIVLSLNYTYQSWEQKWLIADRMCAHLLLDDFVKKMEDDEEEEDEEDEEEEERGD